MRGSETVHNAAAPGSCTYALTPMNKLVVFDLQRGNCKGHTHAVQERFLLMQSATDPAMP
jgi:hypothetical protein